jgi:hypothetical protein
MRHLSFTEILETINGGRDCAEHLKVCKLCLDRTASLAEFASNAKRVSYIKEKTSKECLTPDEIAGIVEGKTEDIKGGQAHIAECGNCFVNAAHYYSQSLAMEKEANRLGDMVPRRYIEAAKGIPRSVRSVRSARAPKRFSWFDRWVFAPFPAYAMAALLLLTIWTAPANMTIAEVSGGDSYTVYKKTTNGMPYLFFGDVGKVFEIIEASMKVAPMKRDMHFSWSEMPGVEKYLFVLQDITDIAPRTIIQLSTKKNFIKIPWKKIEEGKKYRWITAGGISQENYFRGEAGFVVAKKR